MRGLPLMPVDAASSSMTGGQARGLTMERGRTVAASGQTAMRARATRQDCLFYLSAALLLLSLPACADYPKIPVSGTVACKPVTTTVDSALARAYFDRFFAGAADHRAASETITAIERRFAALPLDALTLRQLSGETSPDFATLFFIKRSLSDERNRRFQAAYCTEVGRIKAEIQRNRWAGIVRNRLRAYTILFVPGFHYLRNPTTGADFSNQRKLMGRLGLKVELVTTEEDGTIEKNASIIAGFIRARSGNGTRLILVSTSKGGPETALALGEILRPDETRSVNAWVSVGGLIRGTFLADRVTGWPKSWLARIMFSAEGIRFGSVPGLTTASSRKRLGGIRLPPHILIVQFVGVPLSGDIAGDVRWRYRQLRKYGPNDGLTLLADELLPGGVTIIEPGLDHYYEDPDINLKSLALPNVIVDELYRQRSIEPPRPERFDATLGPGASRSFRKGKAGIKRILG
ncbi:MAG: hypothetical protein JOY92_03155 [Verrucomicrobia bacterium]|nr:hypothetical protein [Verrucomicrobiota bacterium]